MQSLRIRLKRNLTIYTSISLTERLILRLSCKSTRSYVPLTTKRLSYILLLKHQLYERQLWNIKKVTCIGKYIFDFWFIIVNSWHWSKILATYYTELRSLGYSNLLLMRLFVYVQPEIVHSSHWDEVCTRLQTFNAICMNSEVHAKVTIADIGFYCCVVKYKTNSPFLWEQLQVYQNPFYVKPLPTCSPILHFRIFCYDRYTKLRKQNEKKPSISCDWEIYFGHEKCSFYICMKEHKFFFFAIIVKFYVEIHISCKSK